MRETGQGCLCNELSCGDSLDMRVEDFWETLGNFHWNIRRPIGREVIAKAVVRRGSSSLVVLVIRNEQFDRKKLYEGMQSGAHCIRFLTGIGPTQPIKV